MPKTIERSLAETRGDDHAFIDASTWHFSQIRAERHCNIPGFVFDENTGYYDKEAQAIEDFMAACSYLDVDGKALVAKSLALALLAHANQYRDSGEPFSMHVLAVATELAKDIDKPNALVIASGLDHDTIEDTRNSPYLRVTKEIIAEFIDLQVSQKVDYLTQRRSKKLRKELAKEGASQQIIYSMTKDLGVALIKLRDLLHNMRTLKGKKDPISRSLTIFTAREVYIPLAYRLGRPDIADELDYLTLLHDESVDQVRLSEAKELHDQLTKEFDPGSITSRLSSDFQLKNDMRAHLSSVASIYRNTEGRPHVNIDVSLEPPLSEETAWMLAALDLAHTFTLGNLQYRVEDVSSVTQLRDEVQNGITDSLSFWVTRISDGVRFHIHVYPRDVFELEPVRLSVLSTYPHALLEDEWAYHELAQKKQHLLMSRLSKVLEGFDPARDDSPGVIKSLEPRRREGYIFVIGEEKPGVQGPWEVKEGSTVMDFCRSIRRYDWATIESPFVNGERAPFDYVLHANDVVHLDFGHTESHDPRGIHWFHTDMQGKDEVREYIVRLLQEPVSEKFYHVYEQILTSGRDILSQYIPKNERRFVYGLTANGIKQRVMQLDISIESYIQDHALTNVMKTMQKGNRDGMLEDLFYFGVGMGLLLKEDIVEIIKKAQPENAKTILVSVAFIQNLSGQLEGVSLLAKQMGINILYNDAPVFGNFATVRLFLSPRDASRVRELKKRLKNNKVLQRLQLVSISVDKLGSTYKFFALKKPKK